METMDYNKINNNNKGPGLIIFILFILIGTVATVYLMINEPEPLILGQDALTDLNIYDEEINEEVIDTSYEVKNITETDKESKFRSEIVIPKIFVANEELKIINETICEKFTTRYEHLKLENANGLENKFTYKLSFTTYYNEFENGKKILSIRVYERIVDDNLAKLTMYNVYGYNIDLETKELLAQKDIASIALENDFNNLIRNQVKNYVVDKKMIKEENYTYAITGLEESYLKDEKFVIVFNKGEIVEPKYGYLELTIKKMEE